MSAFQDIASRLGLGSRPKPQAPTPSAGPKEYRTVTVTGCSSAASPDGSLALILATKEIGDVAFKVDADLVGSIEAELKAVLAHLRERAAAAR